MTNWLLRGIVAGLAAVPLHILSLPAAPPENPDPNLSQWFRSLTQPGSGASCCDLSDCRGTSTRIGPDGYEVLISAPTFPVSGDQWVRVPPERILQGKDNPIGRGVVCWTPGKGVICFVKPAEA